MVIHKNAEQCANFGRLQWRQVEIEAALGAPSALAFNLLGFVTPGLLIVALTVGLAKRVGLKRCRVGPTLLALSGSSMAMSGIFPIDPQRPPCTLWER